jgi:lambda family phage portal protein
VLGPIAPKVALQRERAARGLKAFYEAAEPSRLHKTRGDRRSANAQNERAIEPLRAQARHLDENFDIASGILDVLVANTVGTDIQPEPQVMNRDGSPAEGVNRHLLKLYENWRFLPDVTWQHDTGSLKRTAARSYFRDGEIFAQKIIGNVPGLDHGTIVKYSIEALEADFVPMDFTDQARGIAQGIEISAWGRPRAYHCYKGHPGDNVYFSLEKKRVLAELMMHLAFRKRFHQLRGVSVFSSVLNRLDDIKEIDEAERVAARVAASMAAAIVKGEGAAYEDPEEVDSEGKPIPREMGFEPGIVFDDLRPGESIETIDTKRPNNALIPFRDSQLRAAAGGVGTSFSSIAKAYLGSYSSQRQELVESFVTYQTLAQPIVYNLCQPMWDGFVDAALLTPGFALPREVDTDTIYDCAHTGPSMPWIDPKREVDAQITALRWRLTSRSRVIRSRGDNPDQVNREIVRDDAEMKRMGIEIITDEVGGSETPPDVDDPKSTPGGDKPPEDQE